jgi:hypothetical protein
LHGLQIGTELLEEVRIDLVLVESVTERPGLQHLIELPRHSGFLLPARQVLLQVSAEVSALGLCSGRDTQLADGKESMKKDKHKHKHSERVRQRRAVVSNNQ